MAGRLTRRAGAAALVLAVTLMHGWVADGVLSEASLGSGAADTRPRRIEVAFVRELAPSAPPAAVQPVPVAPRPRAVVPRPPAPAASAPLPEPEPPPVAQAEPPPPEPAPPLAAAPELPASAVPEAPPASTAVAEAAAPASAAASAPVAFEWPPSTRLSYTLIGNYRGPVEGQARVEWLRSDDRYQVRMDVEVGPPFAPLMRRSSASDGVITPEGLSPRRYDEETKVPFRDPRRLTVWLDADRVRLPAGSELARPPGVQDTASQFVHLTWLFTTQPGLLQVGQSIDIPLALPRRVETWTYDVVERVPLATPFGTVDTMHVKPRRPARGGDLTAEIWVAPTLQYLPARLLIRQDAETYVDLMIRQLPQQAAR